MPIEIIHENDQRVFLDQENKRRPTLEKIPMMDRNAKTGWPLFQVSLFTPCMEDSTKYEPALGGGKCHLFFISAFSFAGLLTRIPGRIDVIGDFQEHFSEDRVTLDNVQSFMEQFEVVHHRLRFRVGCRMSGYGKLLQVDCPVIDSDELTSVLRNAFELALKEEAVLQDICLWEDESSYTQEQMEAAINPEVAVFSGGQIFVDLGELLARFLPNPDLIDYLKLIFKVDEFLAFKKRIGKPEESQKQPLVEKTTAVSGSTKQVSFFGVSDTGEQLSDLGASAALFRQAL